MLLPGGSYRSNAGRMSEASRKAGGVERAADIAESVLPASKQMPFGE